VDRSGRRKAGSRIAGDVRSSFDRYLGGMREGSFEIEDNRYQQKMGKSKGGRRADTRPCLNTHKKAI